VMKRKNVPGHVEKAHGDSERLSEEEGEQEEETKDSKTQTVSEEVSLVLFFSFMEICTEFTWAKVYMSSRRGWMCLQGNS